MSENPLVTLLNKFRNALDNGYIDEGHANLDKLLVELVNHLITDGDFTENEQELVAEMLAIYDEQDKWYA